MISTDQSGSTRPLAFARCTPRTPRRYENLFTDEVYSLYASLWERQALRLERMTPEFFRGLGEALPGQASLTLLYQSGRPIAFGVGVIAGDVYHTRYGGYDYLLNHELDVYFNLCYQVLDDAFRQGVRDVDLGQTSDEFKARLGSIATPLWFFVRGTGPFTHVGLQVSRRFTFPRPKPVVLHHVFKASARCSGDTSGPQPPNARVVPCAMPRSSLGGPIPVMRARSASVGSRPKES